MSEKEKSYTELKEELDNLLDWFESSEADVDEALKKYDQAAKLIAELENKLKDAELIVKKLTSKKCIPS